MDEGWTKDERRMDMGWRMRTQGRPVGRRMRKIQAESICRGDPSGRPYMNVSSRRFCRIILLIHFGGKPHAKGQFTLEGPSFRGP